MLYDMVWDVNQLNDLNIMVILKTTMMLKKVDKYDERLVQKAYFIRLNLLGLDSKKGMCYHLSNCMLT